jgi:hypothetical protein
VISFRQFFTEAVLHTGGVAANITDVLEYIDSGQVKSISDLQLKLGNGSLSYWIDTDGNIISGKDSGKIGDDVEHWDIIQSHFPIVFAMDTDTDAQEEFLNKNGYFSLSMFSNEGIFIRALHGIDFPSELVKDLELVVTKIDPRLKVVVKRE